MDSAKAQARNRMTERHEMDPRIQALSAIAVADSASSGSAGEAYMLATAPVLATLALVDAVDRLTARVDAIADILETKIYPAISEGL